MRTLAAICGDSGASDRAKSCALRVKGALARRQAKSRQAWKNFNLDIFFLPNLRLAVKVKNTRDRLGIERTA
jgi:hypothetical protein